MQGTVRRFLQACLAATRGLISRVALMIVHA
jgi:hypothetical protein